MYNTQHDDQEPNKRSKPIDQRSTEGRRSSAEGEGFSPSASPSTSEGLHGRRPKFFESWHIPKLLKYCMTSCYPYT